MSEATGDRGDVTLRHEGQAAHVTFMRPKARNAMTFHMYERLRAICDELDVREDLRVVVFRGAEGTFVAGTDISEFTAFAGGADGVAYEKAIDDTLSRLETLPAPTLAVVEGAAVGGGLAMAATCDIRIVTPDAKFGVPIARTVGNCLSAHSVARLVRALGEGPAKQLLLLSDMLTGEDVHRLGFAARCVAPESIDAEVEKQVARLCSAAPLTVGATREIFRGLKTTLPDDSTIIERVYGSRDFGEGVAAFLAKRKPEWAGR